MTKPHQDSQAELSFLAEEMGAKLIAAGYQFELPSIV